MRLIRRDTDILLAACADPLLAACADLLLAACADLLLAACPDSPTAATRKPDCTFGAPRHPFPSRTARIRSPFLKEYGI
ncbi:hypothetical protein [Actinoplanes sp. M2I2]|uniref:hypothetical protein n=1 Tax=Actinoplanes sp. M2I2 TaxID=1734444 RepID=UPI0020208495|nr:hypothetical protein [Actinoplanes sp. M2I2]